MAVAFIGKFLAKKAIKKGIVGLGFLLGGPVGAVGAGFVASAVTVVVSTAVAGPAGLYVAVASEVAEHVLF